jgi:hypothetical protein
MINNTFEQCNHNLVPSKLTNVCYCVKCGVINIKKINGIEVNKTLTKANIQHYQAKLS